MTGPVIALAADHAGCELKNSMKFLLEERSFPLLDLGPETADLVDYRDMAGKLAATLEDDRAQQGLLVCGTGIGIAIAADRYPRIRAAVCHDVTSARLARSAPADGPGHRRNVPRGRGSHLLTDQRTTSSTSPVGRRGWAPPRREPAPRSEHRAERAMRRSGILERTGTVGRWLGRGLRTLAIGALAIALDGAPADAQTKFEPEQAFRLLDENGDGAVARDEFLRRKTEIFFVALDAAGAEQVLRPQDVRLTAEAFAQADINGDGLLSGSEFIQAPFMEFESFDADSDGKITLEEFAAASRMVVD